jgi:predicted GNAT family N-acyltransferase
VGGHMTYQYETNFKDLPKLRESFFELSLEVFGINFQPWYEKGYWTSDYEPHGWFLEDQMLANVSVNHMQLFIDNHMISAIQIGTVMTHEDYRNRGLAKKLIKKIIDTYENNNSFIYLFANNNAKDFYKKIGFQIFEETDYYTDYTNNAERIPLRKLDLSLEEDHYIFDVISKQRVLFKSDFEMVQKSSLSGFYGYLIYQNHLYLDEASKTIYIMIDKDDSLELIDIIQTKTMTLDDHLKKIVNYQQRVHFYFKPETIPSEIKIKPLHSGDSLMIYGLKTKLPCDFRFKKTNQA